MTLHFGRYRGYAVRDLPAPYLAWLVLGDILFAGQLRDEARAEYERRTGRIGAYPARRPTGVVLVIDRKYVRWVREIVERGFRAAARVHHPDAGGDPETMRTLNDAAGELRAQLIVLEAGR